MLTDNAKVVLEEERSSTFVLLMLLKTVFAVGEFIRLTMYLCISLSLSQNTYFPERI